MLTEDIFLPGFVDFFHNPEFEITTLLKLELFPSSGEGRETPILDFRKS
jgi:hypothetical protein